MSFATNGNSHVHLTGYLTGLDEVEEAEEEEDDEEEADTEEIPKRRHSKNNSFLEERKSNFSVTLQTNNVIIHTKAPKKKSKPEQNNLVSSQLGEESEDSSDSEFEIDSIEEEEVSEEEEIIDSDDLRKFEEESEEDENTAPKLNGISNKHTSTPAKAKQIKEEKSASKESKKKNKQEEQQKPKLKKQVLKGGVIVEDLKEGQGEVAKPGKFVHVYYEGRLKDTKKMFDSTTKGPGFSFRIGKGEVIKGWDVGIAGMKVGGKRRITCPPNAGYGLKGSPPVIPPNSTLVFEVELRKIT